MIQLVSFDVWGTLVAAPPRLPKLLANYLATQTEKDLSDIRNFIRTMGSDFDRSAVRSGRDIPSSEKLFRLARAVGISKPRVDELQHEVMRHLEVAPPYLIEPAACLELWALLRNRRIEIAFASNSGFVGGEMMRVVLTSLGLLDDETRCVFSDELGFAKPNAEFFRQVAGTHDPTTVLHIGDDPDADVAGAAGAGMPVLHYVRGQKTTAARVEQIGSIASLCELIDSY